MGFGEIGPAATATALPYLERELASEFKDVRYLVVESLGRLGPAADSLVGRSLPRIEDTTVRQRAAALLKSRQQSIAEGLS